MTWTKLEMAKEALNLIPKGSSINLGIGLPTLISEILPEVHDFIIHSENGVLGVGRRPTSDEVSPTLINAGKETITVSKGASFFDSSTSFGMIRGGHIDYCILGGMEVDVEGSLANWMIPGKKITGMGGAMDLVNGAKKVIVMMSHKSKDGDTKLLKVCALPLTGANVVSTVVTEMGVFEIKEGKFKILKIAKDIELKDLGDSELFSD